MVMMMATAMMISVSTHLGVVGCAQSFGELLSPLRGYLLGAPQMLAGRQAVLELHCPTMLIQVLSRRRLKM